MILLKFVVACQKLSSPWAVSFDFGQSSGRYAFAVSASAIFRQKYAQIAVALLRLCSGLLPATRQPFVRRPRDFASQKPACPTTSVIAEWTLLLTPMAEAYQALAVFLVARNLSWIGVRCLIRIGRMLVRHLLERSLRAVNAIRNPHTYHPPHGLQHGGRND